MFPAENELKRISTGTASKGNQPKYVSIDGIWYFKENLFYQDRYWRDDLVEVVASNLAHKGFTCGTAQVLTQYSDYRFGTYGTFSRNFAQPDEEFIPFYRLLRNNNFDITFNKGLDTFLQICEMYSLFCNLDATDFLLTQTVLDFLVGNEDRHTSNFGVLFNGDSYRLHPCFDFGLGMFEHDRMYEEYKFRDKVEHMQFKTFGSNQMVLIEQLKKRYHNYFTHISHLCVKPSEFKFPSVDAETYLRNACIRLEVSLCND